MYPRISPICLVSSWRSPSQRLTGAGRLQKRDTEPGIWRFVLGALATFFLDFFKTFGSKKRVRHGISLRSIKKEIQNRLKTKKVRSSESWSSKKKENFRKSRDFWKFSKIFENFRNHDFSKIILKIEKSWFWKKISKFFKNLKIFENSQNFSRTNFRKT